MKLAKLLIPIILLTQSCVNNNYTDTVIECRYDLFKSTKTCKIITPYTEYLKNDTIIIN